MQISRTGFLLLSVSASMTACANLLIRKGVTVVDLGSGGTKLRVWMKLAQQPAFVLGFIVYGVAALVWFRVLSTEQITTSYPVLVGMTFALVTIGAVLAFQESVSATKLLGMVAILAGIVLVSRG